MVSTPAARARATACSRSASNCGMSMCVCESATEKGAAGALESPVTRLAYGWPGWALAEGLIANPSPHIFSLAPLLQEVAMGRAARLAGVLSCVLVAGSLQGQT